VAGQGTELSIEPLLGFVGGSIASFAQLLLAAARKGTFARIINCPTYPIAARTLDLAPAVSRFRDVLSTPGIYHATVLARLYSAARRLDYRKRTGQFFTPPIVAEWALSMASPSRTEVIWDAGCGTGVFAEVLLRRGFEGLSCLGIENDPILALCAAHVLEAIGAPASFKVWYTNFLVLERAASEAQGLIAPSLIVSNPPFVRFHKLLGRSRMLATLKGRLGIRLSSFSGAGGYFVCRSVELLRDRQSRREAQSRAPRMLVFAPKEAAGASHWRRLREDLRRVEGWSWNEYSVPGGGVGGGNHHSNSLALLYVFERTGTPATASKPRLSRGAVLGDIMEIKRGISTGCNDFFVLTDAEAKLRGIPRHCLRAVLPTRIAIMGRCFSETEWDALRVAGHPCWLLALPNVDIRDLETSVQTYLRKGVRQGLHATPTAQRLRIWYSLPIPDKPPDVFVTYLFRGAPRFVLNSARVLHLTNILGGRFSRPMARAGLRDAVVESLNGAAKGWIGEQRAGREYRDGLRKIEPRELQDLPIDPCLLDLLGAPRRSEDVREPTLFE
jgi:hypothetical protein